MTCPLHTAPQLWCRQCMPTLHAVRDALDGPSPLHAIETKPTGPGCWEHWWTKSDCESCAIYVRDPSLPLLRETIAGSGQPSPSHDAAAARIAGLEANVNEKLATIAALESQFRETEARRRNACATITDITDALGITGPHQGIDDSEALAAVREYVMEQRGVIDKLRDEVARLSAVEIVAITAARISALATALRKSLADVDPKAMSTYEQQQARREARALLEEVAR